jgi:hypothetical protein
MVNLGDDDLKEKRGWSQRKIDMLRLALIIGLYIFFIYIAFSMVWTDQQCRYILPTKEPYIINLTDSKLPTLYEFLSKVTISNSSNCTRVTHCYEVLECNVSVDNKCWSEPC